VLETVERVRLELKAKGIRLHVDDREGFTPGFKFNDWEMRGVPPAQSKSAPRMWKRAAWLSPAGICPEKLVNPFVPQADLAEQVEEMLGTIQKALFEARPGLPPGQHILPGRLHRTGRCVGKGWAQAWWCESAECEAKVKEETKATTRCMPLDQPGGQGKCIVCGETAQRQVIFAKAY